MPSFGVGCKLYLDCWFLAVPLTRINSAVPRFLFKTMAQDRFYFTDPKSPIRNLSNTEIDKVIKAYEACEPVNDIREEFNIPGNKGMYNDLPYILTDEACSCCDALAYYKPRREGHSYKIIKHCLSCYHDYTDNCSCNFCETERADKKKKEEEKFAKAWKNHLDKEYRIKHVLDDISIYDEISLAVIASNVKPEKNDYIRFLPMSEPNGFENYGGFKEHKIPVELTLLMNPLIKRDLIIPSIHCERNVAKFKNDTLQVNYDDLSKFYWEFNVYEYEDYQDKVTPLSLLHSVKEREFSTAEKSALWRDIYKNEIRHYAIHVTQEILRFDLHSHLYDYITDILIEDYSLSQAYALIYFTTSAALRYEAKYPVDNRRLNTFFRNKISEYANRFRTEKTAKNFNRISYFEISLFNQFVMKNILGDIESKFFYLKTEDIIPEFQSEIIDEL